MLILLLFVLSFLAQLYFYFNYFIFLIRPKIAASASDEHPVSIIIAAKNEEQNLRRYLPEILKQDYKEFEVIIVDDHSSDDSLKFIGQIVFEKLSVYSSDKNGKKAAIQLGIDNAMFEHLVFIDADCKPASKLWLKEMSSHFNSKKKIVLGYGRFFKQRGILNKIIRFEGLINAIQYFSFSLRGKPYMGVGRNLAYTKSVYIKSRSFETHASLKSGDDDLFVNEMATSNNAAISIEPNSHTYTAAKENWKDYFYQRRRQLQAGVYYKLDDRLRLMFFGLSNLLFYVSFIVLMLLGDYSTFYSLLFVSKLIIQIIIFKKIMANLGDEDLLFWIPILEFIYLVQISLIGVSTWIWKSNRWK